MADGERPMVMVVQDQDGVEADPMEVGASLEVSPDLVVLEVHFHMADLEVLEVLGWVSTISKVDLKVFKEVQVKVVGVMEEIWEVRNQVFQEKMRDLREKKEVIMKETMVVVKVRII